MRTSDAEEDHVAFFFDGSVVDDDKCGFIGARRVRRAERDKVVFADEHSSGAGHRRKI